MKILCTGGEGFIGSNLVAALKKEGHDVESYDLRSQLNCLDYNTLAMRMKNKEIVYHLGNIPCHRLSLDNKITSEKEIYSPRFLIQNNIMSTLNVLELCRKYDIKMIFASSFAVYGNQLPPWHEDMQLESRTPYGLSKIISEALIANYNRMFGVTAIILRFSNVYGPGQNLHIPLQVIPLWLEQIKQNKQLNVYGSTTNRDFTHVDDVVRGMLAAMNFGPKKHIEIINLCAQRTIYLGDIAEFLYLSDKSIEYSPLPKHEASDWWGDNSKAKRLLGWEPKKDFWKELEKMKKEALNDKSGISKANK